MKRQRVLTARMLHNRIGFVGGQASVSSNEREEVWIHSRFPRPSLMLPLLLLKVVADSSYFFPYCFSPAICPSSSTTNIAFTVSIHSETR